MTTSSVLAPGTTPVGPLPSPAETHAVGGATIVSNAVVGVLGGRAPTTTSSSPGMAHGKTFTSGSVSGSHISVVSKTSTAPLELFLKGPSLLERRRGSASLSLRNSFDEGAGTCSDDSTPPLTPENGALFPTVGRRGSFIASTTASSLGPTFELSASGSRKTLKSISSAPCVLQEEDGGEDEESPHKRQKSSSFRGVSRCAKDGRWQSRIRIGKKVKYLGRFKTEMEAAERYDEAALALHGTRASLNFELGSEDLEAAANAAFSKRSELGLAQEDFEVSQAIPGSAAASTTSIASAGRTSSPTGSPASSRSGSRRSTTPAHLRHHHQHHHHHQRLPHHHSALVGSTSSASSSAANSPLSSATTTPTNTSSGLARFFFSEDVRPGGHVAATPVMEPIAEGVEEAPKGASTTPDDRFAAMTLLCLKALTLSPEAMLC